MTGIRQSFVFCRERDGYGTGIGENVPSTEEYEYKFIHVDAGSSLNMFVDKSIQSHDYWLAPPPGSYFSHTSTRTVSRVQTTGSKFWDAQAYGQLQGTWEWSFVLDPLYIEPLLFAFEEIVLNNRIYNTSQNYGDFYNTQFLNYYRLSKINNVRVRSFTVKLAIDNTSIKGGYNEMKILRGCVVKDIRFTKDANTSLINVTMSGFYANESLVYSSSNPVTVYKEPVDSPSHFEWMAAYLKKNSDSYAQYMSDVSSMSLSISNSSQAVYTICSPYSSNYSEGQTSISLNLSTYYTDPRQYRTILMDYYSDKDMYGPKSKGIKPMPRFYLLSTNTNNTGSMKFPGVFTNSQSSLTQGTDFEPFAPGNGRVFAMFLFNNMAIKSLAWEKGDGGSPLQDRLDGNDCQTMSLGIGAYPSDYTSTRLFHRILTASGDSAVFNGSLIDPNTNPDIPEGAGTKPIDWFVIASTAGALASATKVYFNDYREDYVTRAYANLDGWFAPYQWDSIPVMVYGWRWEQIGTDSEDQPVYGWVCHNSPYDNLNSEYGGSPTATGWLYSNHFAETFTAPSEGRSLRTTPSLSVDPTDMPSDMNAKAEMASEDVDELLINTNEENNEV